MVATVNLLSAISFFETSLSSNFDNGKFLRSLNKKLFADFCDKSVCSTIFSSAVAVKWLLFSISANSLLKALTTFCIAFNFSSTVIVVAESVLSEISFLVFCL